MTGHRESHSAVRRLTALLLMLALAGCAAGPSLQEAGRSEDDKAPDADHEQVEPAESVDADVRADFDTALRHLRAGEYAKGAELLRRVVERAPRYTAPYINLAVAYQKMGDLKAAEESIQRALAVDANHPVAGTEYGLILRKTGRFAEARKAYERTLAAWPGYLPARKNLGILCDIYLRDLECALEQYRLYGAAAPEDEQVRLWIADIEQRLGGGKP